MKPKSFCVVSPTETLARSKKIHLLAQIIECSYHYWWVDLALSQDLLGYVMGFRYTLLSLMDIKVHNGSLGENPRSKLLSSQVFPERFVALRY